MKDSVKNKKLAEVIRLAYESLETHLIDTYQAPSFRRNRKVMDQHGGRRFHIQAVKDYAKMIKLLSDLL